MLFALGEPVAFAGLLIAFLLGLVAARRRHPAHRPHRWASPTGASRSRRARARTSTRSAPSPPRSAALGWGQSDRVDEVPRHRGRGRAAAVFAAGPLTAHRRRRSSPCSRYALLYPDRCAGVFRPGRRAARRRPGAIGEQLLLSLAVGLLSFGLLALIPIPPLDGFGLL